jgi:hypothetical protein
MLTLITWGSAVVAFIVIVMIRAGALGPEFGLKRPSRKRDGEDDEHSA